MTQLEFSVVVSPLALLRKMKEVRAECLCFFIMSVTTSIKLDHL